MLPSTGYFKSINCPFYETGCCDRPYCHFKHLRRDDGQSTSSSAAPVSSQVQEVVNKAGASAVASTDSKTELHQLVNDAVKKMLETQEVGKTETMTMTDEIVARVVEQLKPTIASTAKPSASIVPHVKPNVPTIGKHVGVPSCVTKPAPCVYNPTPIAELKKRHIPVPVYMPTRESKVAVKRKSLTDVAKPWSSMLKESTNSRMPEITYKPTAIASTMKDSDSSKIYVPTLRSDNSSSNSYDDGNSNDYIPKAKESYYPKSKKRREEYVPKKVKAPLKSVQHLQETPMNDFTPEFDMLDEILTSARTNNEMETNDDSQGFYDIEPKFSEDELEEEDEVEEVIAKSSTNEVQKSKLEVIDHGQDGKENDSNMKHEGVHMNKSKSYKSSSRSESLDDKLSNKDSSSSSVKQESRRNSTNVEGGGEERREKDKKKDRRDSSKSESRRDSEKSSKKDHRSDRSHDKNKKDSSECKDKNKNSTSSKDKHRSSSSNNDRDRSKDSHSSDSKKYSSHRSSKDAKSQKDKVPSSKSDECKSRSSKSRHSSSSSRSRSEKKGESGKSSEKHISRSSSHKSSSSGKKSSSRKESSSERSVAEIDDHSNSPFESSFIDDALLETSDSDHDVEEECLKIFQEYEPANHPKGVTVKEAPKPEVEDEDVGRKRVAHPSAASSIVRAHGPSQPPKKLKNPQQLMYDRWRKMKEAAAEKAAENAIAVPSKAPVESEKPASKSVPPKLGDLKIRTGDATSKSSHSDPQLNGNGRIRIAHVPYAMSLALAKKKVNETVAKAAVEAKTVAQTTRGARVAHIPQVVPQLVAPEPLQVTTQKFPLNVRQHYVNLMHVICVQIYTNGEDAGQRALREELACHDRCKALTVYKNSCMLAAHRLRKEVEQGLNDDESLPSASGIVSHNAVLAGKSKGSWSVEKTKKSVMDFRGTALYDRLKKWIMSEQQLRDNGFPRSYPDGPKGRAKVYVTNTRNHSILSKVPNERYCCRCNKPYMVNKHGLPVQQQNCIYHWGRKFTTRGESKYSCCQQYGFASGCADAKNHVWEYVDYENLRGYVKTLPKGIPAEEQGVYALDCEMSYTTQGLELTRVTVINEDCNTIYETLVMPENPIIDYNTRFSGITEESMKGVKTTLLDVQATLLTMFSELTILVGHSLESDFKALKLIHDTVVDTSIMFPHKNGPPHKRALRNLCSEYLRKIIQNEVGGHDSAEDAIACMDLIHWKVKEEAKLL